MWPATVDERRMGRLTISQLGKWTTIAAENRKEQGSSQMTKRLPMRRYSEASGILRSIFTKKYASCGGIAYPLLVNISQHTPVHPLLCSDKKTNNGAQQPDLSVLGDSITAAVDWQLHDALLPPFCPKNLR